MMLSRPLTLVKPHRSPPSLNLHPPVTDLYKYLAPANWAGKHLRGETVGGSLKRHAKKDGGVGGTVRKGALLSRRRKVSQ